MTPITDREKLLIDAYITNVPEYEDIDENDIDEALDRVFDYEREKAFEDECTN